MDTRADVYAAGLVLYEMITGLPAASFPRLGERARQIVDDTTLNLLMRTVLRACQPDPKDRFQDARPMLGELEPSPEAASGRPRAQWRILAAAACAVAALVIGIFTLWPTPPERVHVNFITEAPFFEATVYLDGRQQMETPDRPYTTPCTIENLPARVHHVVFRLQGLPPVDAGEVDFAEVRQIMARWETNQ